MKKVIFTILVVLGIYTSSYSQTLIGAYDFPYYNPYNYFWGVTQRNDTLWIGSGFTGTGAPTAIMYKVSKTGVLLDSVATPFSFNHGLAWDGSGFWIAEDYRTAGGRIYKISPTGARMDSIFTGAYAAGIGGIALDGNNIWFAVYYPDNASYPFDYAYKMNLTSRLIVDSIPLRTKQCQGIAVKGDTIFYVSDNMQGDPERIYAYRKAVGDTLFSFACPDPDGDQDPKGLFWDGTNLFMIGYRIGGNAYAYRTLYKYAIAGQGSPSITTSSSLIDFGNVNVGTTGTQQLQINNIGTASLIISGKVISNPRFGINPSGVPDTIAAGQSKTYNVIFTPLTYDSLTASLTIQSNDMATPSKIVTLKGKGVNVGANIQLSTSSYDFSQRRTGSLCGFIFNVTNTGSSPLNISSMNFTTARYRIDTVGQQFPVVIDTQKTKRFRVWFNPIAGATYYDSLTIISNAVNLPTARIVVTGQGQVINAPLGYQYWIGYCPTNPYTSVNDYQPVSIKQINDVNNDGVNDVVIASGNYYVTCYNGNSSVSADTLWTFNTGYSNINSGSVQFKDGLIVRDDIDGDGVADVVFGCAGGNEMVYCVSGRTGKQIWTWGDSITYSDGDIEEVRCDKDYNGDGVNDVLVSASGTGSGTGGRHALVCLDGKTGAQIFYFTETADFTADIISSQFGGAIGLAYGSTYSVLGFNNTGSQIWTYPTTGKIWSMREIPTIGTDTVKEIVGYVGFAGNVFCITGNNGTQNWVKSLGSANNGTILLLDDLDSNGYIDLTASGPQSLVRFDSKTNNTLWTFSPGASYVRDVDFLSDVNGDGKRDIVVGMQSPGRVYVLNGATGTQLFMFEFGSSTTYRADRVAVLNSIDGNPSTEFVAGCRDGRVICFAGGPNIPIGITPVSTAVPEKFSIEQNYPNPFNPVTKIKFSIPKLSFPQALNGNPPVNIKIFDITGKEITTLVNEILQPGIYEISFDAGKYSSGVYFYQMTAGSFRETKRMVLLK